MDTKSYSTSAIIIKRVNYSEADRIITLFTREYGKLSVIAKGVRKSTSRRKGHVELFNHVQAQIIQTQGLHILTHVEAIEYFADIPTKFPDAQDAFARINIAYHLTEIVDKLLPEHQPSPVIFDWLRSAYAHLHTQSPNYDNLHRSFKLRLLQELGFWPDDNQPPVDIDAYLESVLERPLQTSAYLSPIA